MQIATCTVFAATIVSRSVSAETCRHRSTNTCQSNTPAEICSLAPVFETRHERAECRVNQRRRVVETTQEAASHVHAAPSRLVSSLYLRGV